LTSLDKQSKRDTGQTRNVAQLAETARHKQHKPQATTNNTITRSRHNSSSSSPAAAAAQPTATSTQ